MCTTASLLYVYVRVVIYILVSHTYLIRNIAYQVPGIYACELGQPKSGSNLVNHYKLVTIQSVVLTADVFQLFVKLRLEDRKHSYVTVAGPNTLRIRLDLAEISKKTQNYCIHFWRHFWPTICTRYDQGEEWCKQQS